MLFWAKRSPASEGMQSGCVLEWHFSTEVIDFMPGEVMDLFYSLSRGTVFHATSSSLSPAPSVAVHHDRREFGPEYSAVVSCCSAYLEKYCI